jgi:16S rRNA (adenine1518-N6/adenine1519-N6)-dimethyltransferase
MRAMTLSEMRRWLDSRGIQLTRSLGQNFLHDGNQLRRIATAGELSPSDKLLEIGPGLGPLTELLIASGAPVLAIEKDQRLVEVLRERFADQPSFELLHDDALEWLKREERDWTGWKLVANLPYSVGSPILVELALSARPPERLVATLQREVVQRIAAKPGTEPYGLLSLLLQIQYEPIGTFSIPAGCFFPAPDVESACVTLKRRSPALLEGAALERFVRVVKLGFSQRRKMMVKQLRTAWSDERLTPALTAAGIPLNARAEDVALEAFVTLVRHLPAS